MTKHQLEEFVSENSFDALDEAEAFEHFCGFLVTSEHYSETLNTDHIHVGAGGDCGIDCLAIIVNGSLVTDPEEIEDLEGFLDVVFVFVQAQRSASFATSKIGQFGFGVRDFFSDSPQLTRNLDVVLAAKIMNKVFERSPRFRGNPRCYLYYATTGTWTDDSDLVARRDAEVKYLKETNLFQDVRFDCLGASELQAFYQKSKNAVATQITFTDKTVLPEIPGVEQAYVGVLPAPEFMKLIENDNEEVLTSLFYDNVRHWQEWNPVNSEMRETLQDQDRQVHFPLLNNGVTIVAKRVQATGNRFLVEDYQVVNGCQTSYVLHEERHHLSDRIYVPVRLIATDDPDIRNSIIKATNRQTPVSDELFIALTEFPKKLELYFPTFDGKKKLYYERRPRQYAAVEAVEKVRVIDLRTLVRAFASIFEEIPHRTTRNFKALLRTVGSDIFGLDHRLDPYYVAAFASYRLEFLFRNQILPAELKPARYHLLLAFRLLIDRGQLPPMNSHEMERYCSRLLDVLWDDDRSRAIFEQAAALVRQAADGDLNRDNIRTEPFTEKLIAIIP